MKVSKFGAFAEQFLGLMRLSFVSKAESALSESFKLAGCHSAQAYHSGIAGLTFG